MNAGELLNLFRSEMVHANVHFPFDRDLYYYIDEGYKEFVRQSGGVPDEIEIDVDINEPEVDIPEYVLRTRQVRRSSDGGEVAIKNQTDIVGESLTKTGEVTMFVTGLKRNKARLISVPVVSDVLLVQVDRLPISKITKESNKFSDIDEGFHIHLLDWVKYRVYARPVDGLFDPKLSSFFQTRFVGEVKKAASSKGLNKAKVRTVAYGGL